MSHVASKPKVLILDGGLGTTLEDVFHQDISHALWSAKPIEEDPEVIIAAHLAFLRAGANIILTSTYQCAYNTFERAGYSREDAKRIKVHFNADTSDALPWSFVPQQKFVSVLPGETSLAFYKAKNNSDKDIIGIATYNVTPDRIAPYFAKVECFCFEEQKLLAGEEVDMPLLFFIDKDVLDDPSCRNLDDIVLSYTFFRARRNAQGHLEPDASDEVVQASQGFAGIEMAPRVEDRKKNDTTSS